jgi:PTH1 family peptidyl-tRNA hydrolase
VPILSALRRLIGPDRAAIASPTDEDSLAMPADLNTKTDVRVVVGLGNPGGRYADTRHNLGFFVVDELAKRVSAPESRRRFKAEVSEARRAGGRFILVKPQTYMNESGVAVREVTNWYKSAPEQVLIVVDDLDIPFGQIRIRARGSAGGHNGLKSIFGILGTQEIARLRVGIGRGTNAPIAHVLSRFAPSEREDLARIVSTAADLVEIWHDRGILEAMNIGNDPANQPLVDRNAGGSS